MLTSTRLGSRFLLSLVPIDLGGGIGAVTTLDGAAIPTSSTFGGLETGTSSSSGVLTLLRQAPKAGWSLEARSRDFTETIAKSF